MSIQLSYQKNLLNFILALVFILLSSSANAAPTLLWKMEFDSRIVKTSDLMDFDVGKDGKGGRFPLKTVMTEKSIYVLDSKGKVEKKISLKNSAKTAMSDDGLTIATLKGKEITLSRIKETEIRSQKSELKSWEQIEGVVKIADSQPVVLPQHVFFDLSPNGNTIVVLSFFTHNIYFHNRKGELLTTHHVDDLRSAKVKFSGNGEYAAIHIPNWGKGKTTGYLLFFSTKGKKLWRFEHKGCQATFDISFEGQSIVMAAEDKLYSLDKRGNVLYEKELIPGEMDIALSGDGKYIVKTMTQDHSISLLDNSKGKAMWLQKIKGYDSINSPFGSLVISYSGNLIAITISKDWTIRNKESFLYLFLIDGSIVEQDSFKENRIRSVLSSDSKCIMIIGQKNTHLYKF